MIIKYWKYKWKGISEIAKTDPFYLIWMYWEVITPWRDLDADLMLALKDAIESVWKTIFDKKEKLFEKVAFWKHKWKKYEDLIKTEWKWFLWMYWESKDKDKPNMNLIFTLRYWMTKNWCTLFDWSKWMRHCPSCKCMHN